MEQLKLCALLNPLAAGEPISLARWKQEYDRQFVVYGEEFFARAMAQVQTDVQTLEANQWQIWERQVREPPMS
jgi:hypothetical protein